MLLVGFLMYIHRMGISSPLFPKFDSSYFWICQPTINTFSTMLIPAQTWIVFDRQYIMVFFVMVSQPCSHPTFFDWIFSQVSERLRSVKPWYLRWYSRSWPWDFGLRLRPRIESWVSSYNPAEHARWLFNSKFEPSGSFRNYHHLGLLQPNNVCPLLSVLQ